MRPIATLLGLGLVVGGDHDHLDPDDHDQPDDIPDHDPDQHDDHDDHDDGARVAAYDPDGVQR